MNHQPGRGCGHHCDCTVHYPSEDKTFEKLSFKTNKIIKECYLFFRVTLEDLYNGKTSKLQLSKNVICAVCSG